MSIGEVLSDARRQAGLSIAEISRRTKIRESIIKDIERGEYSSSGGDFYARGHIRSIARVTGTDSRPLIEEYDAARADPDETMDAAAGQVAATGGSPAPAGTVVSAEPASRNGPRGGHKPADPGEAAGYGRPAGPDEPGGRGKLAGGDGPRGGHKSASPDEAAVPAGRAPRGGWRGVKFRRREPGQAGLGFLGTSATSDRSRVRPGPEILGNQAIRGRSPASAGPEILGETALRRLAARRDQAVPGSLQVPDGPAAAATPSASAAAPVTQDPADPGAPPVSEDPAVSEAPTVPGAQPRGRGAGRRARRGRQRASGGRPVPGDPPVTGISPAPDPSPAPGISPAPDPSPAPGISPAPDPSPAPGNPPALGTLPESDAPPAFPIPPVSISTTAPTTPLASTAPASPAPPAPIAPPASTAPSGPATLPAAAVPPESDDPAVFGAPTVPDALPAWGDAGNFHSPPIPGGPAVSAGWQVADPPEAAGRSGWPDAPDYAGPDYAGPDYAGPDYAGPDYAGPDYAGPLPDDEHIPGMTGPPREARVTGWSVEAPHRDDHRRAVIAGIALAMLLAAGIVLYLLVAGMQHASSTGRVTHRTTAHTRHTPPPTPAVSHTATASPSPPPAPRVQALTPVSAAAFGPGGTSHGDDPHGAAAAIDHNPASRWRTDWYTTAHFGNLYSGTGLLLNMGRPVTITSARITLGLTRGANFQLRVGPVPALAALRPVAAASQAGGVVHLQVPRPAPGRYVLIWFTKLPRDYAGTFQASIYNISLQGHP